MEKRGYKLQEFMAHSGNVNCLRIGRKNFWHFLTGGDDNKVNLWSIGKPTCSTSLSGHSSPVESVAFDSAEVLVLAGSSSGAIKLWDLEETKMVRSLTGHRSYCTALEFHPFGEFFASGSMDTNLKVWDIRKKGCIHTYKGHTRGISTIKFSPDGRWVVSGGFDNIVKVWDLTAGKLLHDFKFHEGHVRSIEFHPLEFMLATGSADRTVKFWDLETFEMIGSTRRESAGVRSVTFHPDGRTLFCGLDDGLKVYAWEPVVCHDSVDIGWSTVGDLCIHDGKLLCCAYYENSVGVWVADVSQIAPYGSGAVAKRKGSAEIVVDTRESPLERVGSLNSRSLLPDDDSKDIKNIYVDTAGANCVTLKKGSISSSESVYLETKEMSDLHNQKKGSFPGSGTNISGQNHNRSLVAPSIVPRDIPEAKEFVGIRRESFPRSTITIPLKPSSGKFDMDKMSIALELKVSEDAIFSREPDVDRSSKKALTETQPDIKDVQKKSEKTTLVSPSSNQENSDVAAESRIGVTAVKVVNGVAVLRGRTRSLVERFEKREKLSGDEIHTDISTVSVCQTPKASTILPSDMGTPKDRLEPKTAPFHEPNTASQTLIQETKTSPSDTMIPKPTQEPKTSPLHTHDTATQTVIQESKQSNLPSPSDDQSDGSGTRLPKTSPFGSGTRLPKLGQSDDHTHNMVAHLISSDSETSPRQTLNITTREAIQSQKTARLHARNSAAPAAIQEPKESNFPSPRISTPAAVTQQPNSSDSEEHTPNMVGHLISSDPETSPRKTLNIATRLAIQAQKTARLQAQKTARLSPPNTASPAVTRLPKFSPLQTQKMNSAASNRGSKFSSSRTPYVTTTPAVTRVPRTSLLQNNDHLAVEPQEPDTITSNVIENLMDSHDGVLNTLRSRLTKLQVIRHFWERNDVKGAINATRKLPDYSVQADIVSILVGRMDIITLDLFSCLLPVLLGLLDSKVERHAVVSLEMLLKLVAVFGSVVHATVSAPRTIGVDLHAEERLECCKECFAHLENVRKILPSLIRKDGVVAKSALELNLVLQES